MASSTRLHIQLCLAGTLGVGACTVVNPTGWHLTESSEPKSVTVTPGRTRNPYPDGYDLPDGRRIVVTYHGTGLFYTHPDAVRFSLAFEGDPRRLHCEAGLESTRFGCWDADETVKLEMGPQCASLNRFAAHF